MAGVLYPVVLLGLLCDKDEPTANLCLCLFWFCMAALLSPQEFQKEKGDGAAVGSRVTLAQAAKDLIPFDLVSEMVFTLTGGKVDLDKGKGSSADKPKKE